MCDNNEDGICVTASNKPVTHCCFNAMYLYIHIDVHGFCFLWMTIIISLCE